MAENKNTAYQTYRTNDVKNNMSLVKEGAAEKTKATEELSVIIQNMTTETDIENLVKAKGFRDCVASINKDKISMAVRPVNGELSKADVSKIRDVVLSKTSISSQNIVVVEVK